MIPFLLSSEKLREDVGSVRQVKERMEKISLLEKQGRRYGFGYFVSQDGVEHVGVERNETCNTSGGRRSHVWTERVKAVT